ncbi:SMP-30/gluconolactonase/LRE family protein [Arthrobacter sp. NPDC057013]
MQLNPDTAGTIGTGLSRPECVLAERDGTLWASDNRATACRISPDETQQLFGNAGGTPNGLALDQDGTLYVADIERGLVLSLDRNGTERVVLDQIDGRPLGAVNFPYFDEAGNLWVTVSTTVTPRSAAKETPVADGYIMRLDQSGPMIMAEGLFFTNEIRIDPSGRYLYTAETTAGRISRQPIQPDGTLGRRELFGKAPLFPGAAVDGVAFDSGGNLWVTELSRNAIFVLDPSGREHLAFEDPRGEILQEPSSIAFGGHDLKTLYVGTLGMSHLVSFEAPVAGHPLSHWNTTA